MRLELALVTFAVLALSACGGTPQRAAMPDVASTDQSADDMGLPSATPAETVTNDSSAESSAPASDQPDEAATE